MVFFQVRWSQLIITLFIISLTLIKLNTPVFNSKNKTIDLLKSYLF